MRKVCRQAYHLVGIAEGLLHLLGCACLDLCLHTAQCITELADSNIGKAGQKYAHASWDQHMHTVRWMSPSVSIYMRWRVRNWVKSRTQYACRG